MLKQNVLIHALEKINSKIKELEIIADEVKSSLISDTKSSAGDKHETARAMVQLEQEKLNKQLGEFIQMKSTLNQINPTILHNQVGMGSLIHNTLGWFFLSVGLGQISVKETGHVQQTGIPSFTNGINEIDVFLSTFAQNCIRRHRRTGNCV